MKGTSSKKTKATNRKENYIIMANYNNYYNSTSTHYISNSGSDENGRYHGGAAGDQTGGEWCLRPWYSRPWSCVLRYEKDARVGQKLAELGCAAALNDKIGYDQYQRDTYWSQLKAAGYDPSKITAACESDCSAGVIANTRAVGNLLGIPALANVNATYTGNMRSGFRAAGFTVLVDAKYTQGCSYLLPGDILLYDAAHTATNITVGSNVRNNGGNGGGNHNGNNGGNMNGNPSNNSGNQGGAIATPPQQNPTASGGPGKDEKWKGVVTVNGLNVRKWAGTEHGTCSFSPLNTGAKVSVCDSVKASDGSVWYYIKYNGKYGFVHSKYVAPDSSPTAAPTPTPAPAPTPAPSAPSQTKPANGAPAKRTAYESAKSFSKQLAGTYRTTADLHIRAGTGTDKPSMVVIPKGTAVQNYGYYTNVRGVNWLYVQFTYGNVTYTGFGCGTYLRK
jgi:uncharacterized protein YraI